MGHSELTVKRLTILLQQVMFDGLLKGACDTDILVWSEEQKRWVLVPMS